jgi:hypothetical protein
VSVNEISEPVGLQVVKTRKDAPFTLSSHSDIPLQRWATMGD